MFILLHLFLECLGQTQTFLNLDTGIHILKTLQATSEPNSKIIVKFEQEIFDSTQLLICDSEITLLKENCIYDINSFDLKRNTQVIQLVSGLNLEKYQEQLLSMKQFNESPQVLGTYSKQISNFSITISTVNILECASQCQNSGICKNGMCDCLEGYFGADCSIVALDITLQSLFRQNTFYYGGSINRYFLYNSSYIKFIHFNCIIILKNAINSLVLLISNLPKWVNIDKLVMQKTGMSKLIAIEHHERFGYKIWLKKKKQRLMMSSNVCRKQIQKSRILNNFLIIFFTLKQIVKILNNQMIKIRGLY